jgi:hypothetical protein
MNAPTTGLLEKVRVFIGPTWTRISVWKICWQAKCRVKARNPLSDGSKPVQQLQERSKKADCDSSFGQVRAFDTDSLAGWNGPPQRHQE